MNGIQLLRLQVIKRLQAEPLEDQERATSEHRKALAISRIEEAIAMEGADLGVSLSKKEHQTFVQEFLHFFKAEFVATAETGPAEIETESLDPFSLTEEESGAGKSANIVPVTILGMLVAAEDFVGAKDGWSPANPAQAKFLSELNAWRSGMSRLPELKSMASRNHIELNAFLETNGFHGVFEELPVNTFGAAGLITLLFEWPSPAKVASVEYANKSYPAFRSSTCGAYRCASHPHPIAKLHTKSGDDIFATIASRPVAGLNLLDDVMKLDRDKALAGSAVATIPMVDMSSQDALPWLRDLRVTARDNTPYCLWKAIQETRLGLDEFGMRFESASSGLLIRIGRIEKPLEIVIDKPFLLWTRRQGISLPIMACYLDVDTWRRPRRTTSMERGFGKGRDLLS